LSSRVNCKRLMADAVTSRANDPQKITIRQATNHY